MIIKQVSDLNFLNPRRGQELELRFGVRSRTYFSPFNHYFVHALTPEALRNFSFVTVREGREQLKNLLYFRPGLFSGKTKFAFHHWLIRELPGELLERSYFYRFAPLEDDLSPRPDLLVIGKDNPIPDSGQRVFYYNQDVFLEEIYQQKLNFRHFDFVYSHELEEEISDCFLQYMLLRFGARRMTERKSEVSFRVIKKQALSFRHAIEILKPD